MANYETLKDAIRSAIRENGNNEITGNLLQQSLISMVTSLGAQYQYAGVATPSTNPGTPDQNVFYIASQQGTYAGFGGLIVNDDEVAVLKYNGTWRKDVTGIATAKTVKDILDAGYLFKGTAEPEMDPGTPEVKEFYFASQPGIYSGFGGEVVYDGEVAVLYHDGSGWKKMTTGIASHEALDALRQNTEVRSEFELAEHGYLEDMRFNWDGSIQPAISGTASLLKFRVEGGKQYAFSGRMSATFSLYFLAWYDENENFIYKEPYSGRRDRMVTYDKQLVVAPDNAAFAYMNVNKLWRSYYKMYYIEPMSAQEIYENTVLKTNIVDSLESTATDAPLSANQGRVLNEKIKDISGINEYDLIAPTSVEEGKWVRPAGDVVDSPNWDLATYPCSVGDEFYIMSYITAGWSCWQVNWFDADGNFISHELYKAGPGATYMEKVVAPGFAASMKFTMRKTYRHRCGVYQKRVVSHQEEHTRQFLTDILLGVNSEVEIGKYYISSDGNYVEDARYQTAIISVKPDEKYSIYGGDSGNIRYAFTTSKEQVLGEAVLVVEGTSVVALNNQTAEVTVPSGASYLIVNYSEYYGGSAFDTKIVKGAAASKRKIRILAIGNSYSQDALAYVPFIMKNMGVDADVTIGILMMSSSTIQNHVTNFQNETAAYTYYHYAAGAAAWTNQGSKTIQWALTNYEWDIIFTHQSNSIAADQWDTKYQPYTNQLVNLIYTAIEYPVKFAWMISRVRPAVTNSGANRSDETILALFNATAANAKRVIDETAFDIIIPVGTAVQNALTIPTLKAIGEYASNPNNTSGNGYLSPNDGVHLEEGLPCQIAAYSVILSFLDALGMNNISIFGETSRIDSAWASGKSIPTPHGSYVGSTDDNCRMAQLCAIMAQKNPYQVTDMNYIVNPS